MLSTKTASLPQPLQNPPVVPVPLLVPPDPRTQEMINEKLRKVEELSEKGMIEEAQKDMEEAEAFKMLGGSQEPVLDSSKYTAADVRITDQNFRVCAICGTFLSVYDSDRRLADHFGGKLHLDTCKFVCKLAEMLEERNKRQKRGHSEDAIRSKEKKSRSQRRYRSGSRDHTGDYDRHRRHGRYD